MNVGLRALISVGTVMHRDLQTDRVTKKKIGNGDTKREACRNA